MISEKTEKFLWDTKFPDECSQLPFKYLEENEKAIVKRCIDKEELTDEEKSDIKQLLYAYRPYFKDYNSNVAEKNIDSTNKVIKTQSELLHLVHDPSRYRIDMNYFINGEKYLLQMRIKPFTDKQYLEGVGSQVGLFKDLNKEEKKILSKAEAKQVMSPEEAKMHKALMDKINEKIYDVEYNLQIINEFLADRLEFIDDDKELSFEEKTKFWEQIDINTKTSLFHEVRGRLQLNETFKEDLFPPVR